MAKRKMTDYEQRQLISPVSLGIAALIFGAMLIYDAVEIESGHTSFSSKGYSRRNAAFAAGIHSLAEMLGLVGSIALTVVLLGALFAWAFVVYRRIDRIRSEGHYDPRDPSLFK